MIDYYTQKTDSAIPLIPLTSAQCQTWLSEQATHTQRWLEVQGFTGQAGEIALLPQADGQLAQVLCGVAEQADFWAWASVIKRIPAATYQLALDYTPTQEALLALAWGLGHYPSCAQDDTLAPRRLVVHQETAHEASELLETIVWVRRLISQPANIMDVEALAEEAKQLAKTYGARYKHIVGDSLLRHNFPLIHAVGRAGAQAPRLVELRWGSSEHPELVLIGKGVCFDSGGLNLKSAGGMRLMKKDMGGAAHVLGLARLVMAHQLKLNLRVLLPIVENSVSSAAYRPGDVLNSRKGTQVEVGNTDAEGRLILADALAFAAEGQPQLIIDFATLTGAARVALGTELPALFSNDPSLVDHILTHAKAECDPLWPMPLFEPYAEELKSPFADIVSCSERPYGGAITAALFLKHFVPSVRSWVHIDLMAWNQKTRPGRPEGGEAMGLRALWAYVRDEAVKG